MSKTAENNGLDRWERNYFVSVMSSQFRGGVYICKDQQQRKMCLKTEETKTWGWKCSNVSPNLPKLTHPKYVLSIILYWFCLFLIDEFDLDSLLNGGGISSFADVYQKLKVCCWFFLNFFFLLPDSLLAYHFTTLSDNSRPALSNTFQDFRFFFDIN